MQQTTTEFTALLRLAYQQNQNGNINLELLNPYLNEFTTLRHVPRDDYFVHAGQPQKVVHLLVKGGCYLIRNSQKGYSNMIAVNNPPQFIGATQALTEYTEFYSNILASKDSACLEFERAYFVRQASNNPEVLLYILRNTTRHTMQGSDRMDRLIFNDSSVNLILYIYKNWVDDGSPSGVYRITAKNAMIADVIGINVRTLYRALNQLKSEGLLSVVKGCIVVTPEQLAQIRNRCI